MSGTDSDARPRVALYARVSTLDQHPESQLTDLRRYARERGWSNVVEFVDHGVSGTRDSRPALDKVMAAVRARHVDVVVVSAFDRFGRSVRHLIEALELFHHYGVDFVSLRESIDTGTALGKMVFTIIGAVAELERSLIVERVKAGLRRARADGKRLGRPPLRVDRRQLDSVIAQQLPIRDAARALGISVSSFIRVRRALIASVNGGAAATG